MTKEAYPGQFKTRRLGVAVTIGALIGGGLAGIKAVDSHKENQRPACINIPVKSGDSAAILLERVDKAGLDPSGKTVVFRLNGGVIESNSGFPKEKGEVAELHPSEGVAFEHADPVVCVDPVIGGTVSKQIIHDGRD